MRSKGNFYIQTVDQKPTYEAFLKRQGMKKHPEFAKNDAVRMKAFEKFKNKAFTKLSPEFCGYKALCEGAKRYDAVVTGSDQLVTMVSTIPYIIRTSRDGMAASLKRTEISLCRRL